MNALLEILTAKKWMMSPTHLNAIRQVLQHNIATHTAFKEEKKVMGRAYDEDGEVIRTYCVNEGGDIVGSSWCASEQKVPFVNVMEVSGPILRGGGACSSGSLAHRDMMMAAASNDKCRGHVFVIDTPGGSAWAKNDYQQAIDFARSKGQPVIAFIDGTCASAGMYLAALCDERYYMNPNDEVGCIGVMAAFYSEKDGTHNEYTNETYHELYDPQSFDKNKWYRDIANNDDDKLLIDELTVLGKQFRDDVKKACSTAKNKHLHGRMFAAKDVKGILVDGQATLGDCVFRCFGIMDGSQEPIQRPAHTPLDDEDDETASATQKVKSTIIKNKYIMDKKYTNLAAACGVEELVINEEGTHLHIDLVDALADKLEADAKAVADANDLNATLQKQLDEQKATLTAEKEKAIEDMKADLAKAIETLNAEHDDAMEALKAENAKAIDAMKAEQTAALSEADKAKADTEQQLASTKEALAAAEQKLADREAQIEELTKAAASAPATSPANNGNGLATDTIKTMPAYNERLSPMENDRILNEWKKQNL